ncbi:hypothetical protein LUZ63_008599 [Rhynchospora breviuscula]|uniref:Acyl-[acyl-carrier-protein] hydrolase n=1 Tax=Rhynchospora breviuscula TaxID=2022672 RepID=A0A9Q0CUQ9_9POAL|nr:hypothetical protein LUZ63_008599 [Rhynchospora breviuscula]
MVASIVMSAFFPTSSVKTSLSKTVANGTIENPSPFNFPSKCCNFPPQSTISKSTTCRVISNVNGHIVTTGLGKVAIHSFTTSPTKRTLLDQQSDFTLHDAFGFGRIVQDGFVLNQNFLIRSYDIGADQTASIETLMKHLQEAALNQGRVFGYSDSYGSTREMIKRNIIFVFSKMQLAIDRYPSWGDIVTVDTWIASHGKNGIRKEWRMRDYYSGQTILRATSVVVLMNKLTRKFVKLPEEVRNELQPYFFEQRLITEDEDLLEHNHHQKFNGDNAEKNIVKGLRPKWGDLDPNQHVNNVKYIEWILESVPMEILEKRELAGMTVEFRRECRKDSVIQSETTIYYSDSATSATLIHCDHLLSLDSGVTALKARTTWRPKRATSIG